MAKTFTFTIQDDTKADYIIEGFMHGKSWTTGVTNPSFDPQLPEDPITNPSTIPNPQTQGMFIKAWLIEKIRLEATIGHTSKQNQLEYDEIFNNTQID